MIDLEDGRRKLKGAMTAAGQLVLFPTRTYWMGCRRRVNGAGRSDPTTSSRSWRGYRQTRHDWNHPVLAATAAVRHGQEMARVPAVPLAAAAGTFRAVSPRRARSA